MHAYHLTAGDPASPATAYATILTYGAALQSLSFGGRSNLVLGFDTLEDYLDNPGYIGTAIGRVANRINAGRFEIDGQAYQLPKNQNGHNLHSGPGGLGHKIWAAERIDSGEHPSLKLSHLSPAGTNGFPGALLVSFIFTLTERSLRIEMRANSDAPTLCNLTQHSYFNLDPVQTSETEALIQTHSLMINASHYTPTHGSGIPTGEKPPVAGTPFDFQERKPIGALAIDHNFIVRESAQSGALQSVAEVTGAEGTLCIFSTLPGVQIYTGDGLENKAPRPGQRSEKKTRHKIGPRAGLAIEPQYFPDAPNQTGFGSITLRPGEPYQETIEYVWLGTDA